MGSYRKLDLGVTTALRGLCQSSERMGRGAFDHRVTSWVSCGHERKTCMLPSWSFFLDTCTAEERLVVQL